MERTLGAALVLLALSAASAEVRTFVLGGSEHPWEGGGDGTDPVILAGSRFSPTLDTTNTPGNGIEFAARRGWIGTTFHDGSRNIASLVLEKAGSITAPNSSTSATVLLRAQLEGTVNGDHEVAFERKPVPFNPVVPAFGIWIILDFGQRVGIERIRFYPRNTVVASPDHPFHNDFLRGYEVWLNEQLTSTIKGVPDRLAVREHDNEEPVVDVPMTPQYVRLIKLRSLTELPFEVDEIEVYGTGYMPQGTYLSDLVDLGAPATIGSIRWREQVAGEELFSNLTVGMRSGLDDTPILFLQRIQEFMFVRLDEVTGEEYWALPRSEQVTLQEDLENWSPWKTLENRGLNPAPAPRRFVRFRMEFAGGLFDTRLVERLEFDYLQPPIADTLRAEVFPRLARAEEPATFRYAVLLRRRGEIPGYDRLEIDSNAPVERIRSVPGRRRPGRVRHRVLDPGRFPHQPAADRPRRLGPRAGPSTSRSSASARPSPGGCSTAASPRCRSGSSRATPPTSGRTTSTSCPTSPSRYRRTRSAGWWGRSSSTAASSPRTGTAPTTS